MTTGLDCDIKIKVALDFRWILSGDRVKVHET